LWGRLFFRWVQHVICNLWEQHWQFVCRLIYRSQRRNFNVNYITPPYTLLSGRDLLLPALCFELSLIRWRVCKKLGIRALFPRKKLKSRTRPLEVCSKCQLFFAYVQSTFATNSGNNASRLIKIYSIRLPKYHFIRKENTPIELSSLHCDSDNQRVAKIA